MFSVRLVSFAGQPGLLGFLALVRSVVRNANFAYVFSILVVRVSRVLYARISSASCYFLLERGCLTVSSAGICQRVERLCRLRSKHFFCIERGSLSFC